MTDTFEIGQAEDTFTVGEAGTQIVLRRGAFSLSGGQTDLTFVAGFDRPITLATALATYGLGSLPNGTLVPVMAQASAADNGVYTVASGALVDRVAWTADDNNRGVEIGVMVVVPDELNPSGYVFRVDRQVSFDFANSVFALGPRGLDSRSGAGVAIAGAVAELGWERGRPDLTPTHAMQFTGIAAGILVADVEIPAPTTSFEGWAIVRFDPRPPGDADFAAGFMELPTHVWEPPEDYDPTDFYGVGQDGPQPPVDGEIDSPEWAAHRTQVAGVGETQVFPPGTITSFLEGGTIEHVTTDPEPNEDWSSYQDVGLRDGDVWQLMYIKWTPGQVIHGAASEVAPSIDSDGTLDVPRIRTVTHTLPAAETIFDPTGLPGARWIVGRNFQGEIAMWAYKTDGVLRSHVVASDMTVGATTLTDRVGSRTWEPDPELAGGSEIVAVGSGAAVAEYRLLPETIGDPGQSAVINDAGTGPWYVTPVKGLDTPTIAGRPVVWADTEGRQLAQGGVNTPDGLLRLNGSGVAPDATLPGDLVRTSEMTTAIANALDALVAGAPGALDTLNELAAAVNDDASFAASVTTALGLKVPTTRTLAGLDLSADRTAAALRSALGVSWVTISDATLGAGAASMSATITGYRMIRFRFCGRSERTASANDGLRARFNSDSGTNYSTQGAALAAAMDLATITSSQTNTDRMAQVSGEFTLGSSQYTVGTTTTASINSTGTTVANPTTSSHLWNGSVSNAATTLALFMNSGSNIAAGSRLIVEGIV